MPYSFLCNSYLNRKTYKGFEKKALFQIINLKIFKFQKSTAVNTRSTPWKYLSILSLPLLVVTGFVLEGWFSWLPVVYVFAFIPGLELLLRPDTHNPDEEEEQRLLASPVYDVLLYLSIPIHFYVLWLFLNSPGAGALPNWVLAGKIFSMGIMCGVFGINMAHELGHRVKKSEQTMAKLLLLTSLYMHFYIEHNRGHHRKVSTPEDPATARYGENLYGFWLRSIIGSYRSAWSLENKRLQKADAAVYSLHNEMLLFQLIQLAFLLMIALVWGVVAMLTFVAAALVGILLLETVNYIEHYGLMRKPVAMGYERVMPWHSWNSDHLIGRIMLFELSRHSDHHFKSTRKYQILRHLDDAPQMPTGYPGMMLLAMIPPLWYKVMHARIKHIEKQAA